MFCPSCGSKEINSTQFCRSCGTDLRSVRSVLESPDSVTASAISARDEIGRAIAAKIQQTNSSSELSEFAEEVLPEIEKFLESPEERRLRTVRAGSMVSLIGIGVAVAFGIASQFEKDLIFFSALGLVTLFIGVSLFINGLYFTVPKKILGEKSADTDSQNELGGIKATTNDLLMPPNAQREFSSVTEHTTRHLKDKKPISN